MESSMWEVVLGYLLSMQQLGQNSGTYTAGQLNVTSSPAVANGVIYVGDWDYNLYALNAVTGAKLWNYTTGGIIWSNQAVAKDSMLSL